MSENYVIEDASLPQDAPQPMGDAEVPSERAQLVTKILGTVKDWKGIHEKAFKRMREDMDFAAGRSQWADQSDDDSRYQVNLVQRHIQQRTATLYAKNPTAVARLRERLHYQVWDGEPETLAQAKETLLMASMILNDPVALADPQAQEVLAQVESAQAIVEDVESATAERRQLERVASTLEILYRYYQQEQVPPFKTQAKQLVRRAVTTGVGYVKLGFQRVLERSPEVVDRINGLQDQLAAIERLTAEVEKGEGEHTEAKTEELRLAIQALEAQQDVLVREGLIFDFPRSTSIIPDPDCTSLVGFVGGNGLAQEFLFTPEKVQELYGVEVTGKFTPYDQSGGKKARKSGQQYVCVYEFYDKSTGLMYTVADGYPDFLEEPGSPPIQLEQFFPIFALTFNELEDEKELFPPSDVRLLRSMQVEYNRSREALREHRLANRPQYAAPEGMLEDTEEKKLESGAAHSVVKVMALADGRSIDEILQQIKKHAIDPNLYDTGYLWEDMLRTVGAHEAQMGSYGGSATATEVSVAEGSRMTSQSSAIDELDDFLTVLARAAGQVLLQEVSEETAKKIAGVGAIWPQMSLQEIADEVYLEIEAGSSGKPNKAQELANWERILPHLLSIPDINHTWVARQTIKRLDDRADLSEAIAEGSPSIHAMNRQMTASMGAGGDAPEDQGAEGADTGARPPGAEGGPQAAFPAG